MAVLTELLTEIEAFLANRRGGSDAMSDTEFGLRVANNGKLVSRVRGGLNITVATVDRVRKYIQSQPGKPAAPPHLAANDTAKSATKRTHTKAAPPTKPKRTPRAEAPPPDEQADAA
jgi:hypothetical protein